MSIFFYFCIYTVPTFSAALFPHGDFKKDFVKAL